MKRYLHQLIAIIALCSLPACSFNIQPAVPVLAPAVSNGDSLNCKALLLVPDEFLSREYVSSFESREIRFMVGNPAAQAIEALVRSRVAMVEKASAVGDGTLEFIRLTQNQTSEPTLIIRPRFTRLESSVRPGRYNIVFGLAIDVAGLSSPASPSGTGVGTAGIYTQSAIQKAADTALFQAIKSIGDTFPSTCK